MPARIRVILSVEDPHAVKPEHLHGLGCALLDTDDDGHKAQIKGWTVSPLAAVPDAPGICDWEITIMNDRLIDIAGDRLAAYGDVPLGRQVCLVHRRELVEAVSWADLTAETRSRREWSFDLLTPTTFRSGNIAQPLPLPTNLFGHLRTRWNAFAPAGLDVSVDLASCRLAVTRLEGNTVNVSARKATYPGFVGTVGVRAHEGTTEDHLLLDRLTRIARFTGMGAYTTMGLGVCDAT